MSLPETHITRARSGNIAWREGGKGTPVVMLHGMGGSSATWEHQYFGLGRRLRVVGWDMPGYGASQELPADAPRDTDYADALIDLLDALEMPAAHIVAQSAGALVAGALHRVQPKRIASLTISHGLKGYGSQPEAARQRTRTARLRRYEEMGPARFAVHEAPRIVGPGAEPEVVDRVVSLMASVRARAYRQALEMVMTADFFRDAASISAPAMVIGGEADRVASVVDATAMAAALRDSRLEIIPGCGHYSCLEDPRQFNRVVGMFLREQTG